MTKVLMISTDAKILEEGTPVRARMAEYGALFEELHVVVFNVGDTKGEKGKGRVEIAANAFAYPTDSASKLLYVRDAVKAGSSIIASGSFSPSSSVITCQDPFETGLVGAKLSGKFGLPLHVQIHTDFHSPYFKDSLLNKVRIMLSGKSLAKAKAVRTVSERIRASLDASVREKASVLPIYADIESIRGAQPAAASDLRKKYPQFDKVVLMASRLTKEKDFGTALAAFKEVRREFPRAGLVIVGDGPAAPSIKGEGVAVEPWADRAAIASYMKTCDAFLSSSLYEGYGLSMLEAHSAGATLVATDAGIAPLLADDRALIGPKSPKTMAVALKSALEGQIHNKEYKYPYSDKKAYLEAYRADIERALL